MKNRLPLVTLIALLLAVASSSAFCLTYSVVEIPMPQYAQELYSRSINKFGQVVGYCQCFNRDTYWQAFIYENGVTTLLTGLGGDSSWAEAINDQGWIVGGADTDQYYYDENIEDWVPIAHACKWHSGVVTDLGTLGGYRSGTSDINNLGDIVGGSDTMELDSHGRQISKPFIYINNEMTDLNQFLPAGSGWVLTNVYAINDSRQITGKGKLNGIILDYFMDLGKGTITAVTNPAAEWVRLSSGLNNSGTTTGEMLMDNNQSHCILWNPTTGLTDIPVLPGYYYSRVNCINNANQAVGFSFDDYDGYAGFLFQCGTLININTLIDPASGWNIQHAVGISDAGWIIGYAARNYTSGGVVLVPVNDTAATAKAAANDKPVSFREAPVTAVFGDSFYIEHIDRYSGIRVDYPGHTLQPGMAADVDGVIKTNADGERYVAASHAVQNGVASVKPVGMPLKVLGGGAWKTGTGGSGQTGVTGGVGLNNIGLLVRTWGTLRQGTDGTYYLDDGSGLKLLLETPAGFNKPIGQMVMLNGISSCRKDMSGNVHRLLRVIAD